MQSHNDAGSQVSKSKLQDVIIAAFPWPVTCHTKDLYHYNTGLHRGWGHHCSGELGVRGVFFVLALLLSYEHFIFVSITYKWRLHTLDESEHTRDVCCLLSLAWHLWWWLCVRSYGSISWCQLASSELWAAIMSAVWPDWPVHALMPLMATLCPVSRNADTSEIPTNISTGLCSLMLVFVTCDANQGRCLPNNVLMCE